MEVLLFTLFIFSVVAFEKWLVRDHMIVPSDAAPDPNAAIIDVNVKPIGYKQSRRIKTTVYFSDTTKYVTCKSNNSNGILHIHMKVDQEVLEEILMDAVIAHEKLFAPSKSSWTSEPPF